MRDGPPKRFALTPPLAAVAVLAVLLLSGCGTETAQNTFAPAGEVADRQRDLFFLVMWPALVIMILVMGVLTYALLRFRRRGDEIPKQVHGNTRLELAWTVAPAVLLLVIAVPTVAAIVDLGRDPKADALDLQVTGQQFSWSFEYPDFTDAEGNPLRVVGLPGEPAEAHVPVDREIAISLHSVDVIHSFWVPRLAGKLDVIPGRTNRMWFNATEPGTYRGQCAEFCGLQHADMLLVVVAESEEDFNAWVDDQLGGAAASQDGEERELVSGGE